MLNYKGIFYKEEKEKKYYEGGAHFKYSDLVKILINLIEENNKKIETKESIIANDSKQNLNSSTNKNENAKNENENEKKINSNLLTINNNPNKNNIKMINTHKYILNTEKNIDKEKAKKKRLMELLNCNLKISPFKKNNNNNTKDKKILSINSNNSIEQNYRRKSLKTLENNDIFYDNLNININAKNIEKNNLPLIQSSYYNNLSNKNMFNTNKELNDIKNSIINLKHVSKFTLNKTKISKDNIFLKNKMLSPFKNGNIRRKNAFSKDFSESYKNHKEYDTINIYIKNNKYFSGKLAKYLNNGKSKQKKTLNIKLMQYALKKKINN